MVQFPPQTARQAVVLICAEKVFSRAHVSDRICSYGLDYADGLVTHPAALRARFQRPVRPEVAAADTGPRDAYDCTGRIDDGRVGDILDSDVAGSVHDGCAHGELPPRVTAGLRQGG